MSNLSHPYRKATTFIFADGVATKADPSRHFTEEVVCVDGFRVSVQASSSHYCMPRDNEGPWTRVEVGYPSVRPEPWAEWSKLQSGKDEPTDGVYAWVPVAVVEELIALHGGMKS